MLIFLTLSVISLESQCDCIELGLSEENKYNCDTTFFENGAFLYWQLNCDSTWLTFENKQKVILKSCENEMILECKRIGLSYMKEYPNYLLFIHEWISGCCTPPDLVFISKVKGVELNRISKNQFVWGDANLNYVLYFADSTYTKLIYLDHLTDKEYSYKFEESIITESATINEVLHINDLFKNIEELSFKIN